MAIGELFDNPMTGKAPNITVEQAVKAPTVETIKNGATSYPIVNTIPNPPGSPSMGKVPNGLPFDK